MTLNNTYNHHIFLYDRKSLKLNGIKKIDHFDEQEFLLESSMGWILVKGKQLTLKNMELNKQDVIIEGEINSIQYIEHHGKCNWWSKLLK